MLNLSNLLRDILLQVQLSGHFFCVCEIKFLFHDVSNVVYSYQKLRNTSKLHVKIRVVQSTLLAEFLHVMGKNWKNRKDTFAFLSFLVC